MQSSDIPARIIQPFANSAVPPYTQVPIPQTGAASGRASYSAGFSPLNFIPELSGGIPPWGADMNGILNAVTLWLRWTAAEGPVPYDATFSSTNNGYPKGAVLASTTVGHWWLSTAENNTSNPDTGGANWELISNGTTYAGNPNGNVAGTAVGAYGITRSMLWDTVEQVLWVCTVTGNAATAVWVNVTFLSGGLTPGTYPFATVHVAAGGYIDTLTDGAIATTSALGVVKADGVTVMVAGDGTLSAVTGGAGTITSVAATGFIALSPASPNPVVAGAVTVVGSGATAADVQAGTATTKIIAPDVLQTSAAFQNLTDAATVNWNLALGYNAKVTLGGNRTIGAPTNAKLGVTYSLYLNSGTGGFTTVWNSCFDFAFLGVPVLSTVANKWDSIQMQCYSLSPLLFRCSYMLSA